MEHLLGAHLEDHIGMGAQPAIEVLLKIERISGNGISGNTFSFTNNRITRNGNAGTPPTPIGVATSDTGQQ
jgi:hypothetical protein